MKQAKKALMTEKIKLMKHAKESHFDWPIFIIFLKKDFYRKKP
jgi:hypothetical protein